MELARRHLLYDVWVEDSAPLKYTQWWSDLLVQAAEESGATIIAQQFHQFSPYGVTGFLLLAESHISVHTWPEEGLATIDIFTCGPMQPDRIIERLRERLHPHRERLTTIERGTS